MILSIIIPVYNEEKTIARILSKVIDVELPYGIKKEIIVINDGSFDKTKSIISTFTTTNIKILNHKINLGKGAAVRNGIASAKGDILLIQDADLEYNPNDYNKLLRCLFKNKVNVVYGTRLKNYPLILWGKNKTPLPTHWLGNKFLTFITNILYRSNLTDMETGYKLFYRNVIDGIVLNSNRFEIEPEITAKILKKKFKIVEVPIKVNPRTHLEGKKLSWKDGFIAVRTLVKYRFVK